MASGIRYHLTPWRLDELDSPSGPGKAVQRPKPAADDD
jgi:hypothetical protein